MCEETKPWWSLRGKERAEAKAQYEAAHPLESRHPILKTYPNGQAWQFDGRYYFFHNDLEREIQHRLAHAKLPPMPKILRFAEVDGELQCFGKHSRIEYPVVTATARSLYLSLQAAEAAERRYQRVLSLESQKGGNPPGERAQPENDSGCVQSESEGERQRPADESAG